MTNEELIKHNAENLKLYCRGPRKLHIDRVLAVNAKRIDCLDRGDLVGLQALTVGLNALMRVNLCPEDPDAPIGEWNLALVRLMDLRNHCGRDISAELGGPPFDRQPRKYTCPDCGTEHGITPALSDEEAAAQETAFQSSLKNLLDN